MAQDFGAFCRYCEYLWTNDGQRWCGTCMPNKYRPKGSPWWWKLAKWYFMEKASQLVKAEKEKPEG